MKSECKSYGRVRASMSKVMQRLDGVAKAQVLLPVGQKISAAYHELEETYDNKISDPKYLPEEFTHYGELVSPEEIKREEQERFADEVAQWESECFEKLVDFAHWVWDDFTAHADTESSYEKQDRLLAVHLMTVSRRNNSSSSLCA